MDEPFIDNKQQAEINRQPINVEKILRKFINQYIWIYRVGEQEMHQVESFLIHR